MYMLEKTIGRQKVDTAFQNYFKRWKFKHPQPSDMKAAFEQSVNKSLETFFGLLNKEGALL
jgi:aminopeptidase N